MNRHQDPEPEINTYIRDLLDFNAHNWLAEDFPAIHSLVKSEVQAGRTKADILKECEKIKEMNEDLLNSVKMTIDHLERTKNHKSD